jgi:hypothetical protein
MFEKHPNPDSFRKLFGPAQVDQLLRQAISMCWMMLPEERRTVAKFEVESGHDRGSCAPALTAQNPLLRLPAVGDNAAMSQPFQFSMRRMFAAVTVWCIGAGLLSWLMIPSGFRFGFDVMGVFAVGALGGGGLGIIVRRTFVGAAAGGSLAVVLALAHVVWIFSRLPIK